jgi:hypothetical protein
MPILLCLFRRVIYIGGLFCVLRSLRASPLMFAEIEKDGFVGRGCVEMLGNGWEVDYVPLHNQTRSPLIVHTGNSM